MGCRLNSLFDEYHAGFGDLVGRKLPDKYDPLLDDVETDAEAAASKARFISSLLRCDDPKARQVAATLQTCSANHLCGSGVCSGCDLSSRQVLIPSAENALRPGPTVTLARLEPRSWRTRIGKLETFDLRRFASTQERALQRALPDVTMVGKVDVSLSGWDRGKADWQFGITLFAEQTNSRELRNAIRECFPGDPAWKDQYSFRPVSREDFLQEICHLFGPILCGASQTFGATSPVENMADMAPASAALEAVLCLHKYPIHKRLILCRITRVGGRDRLNLRRSASIETQARERPV